MTVKIIKDFKILEDGRIVIRFKGSTTFRMLSDEQENFRSSKKRLGENCRGLFIDDDHWKIIYKIGDRK